ncbi:MAG TPA: DUF763 domain-containing protein [Verrucomicrobiae bacterium]|nr:DUF763 domain-containing protein [Verrucomicrobiae bacterium]
MKYSTIKLPLHGGHPPPYLIQRMVRLSASISYVLINEYGQHEFLRRLSDPLWFQAFGCVLGFDWHSSGVTTVVTGVLKQSLNEHIHGISIAGGKGRKSMEVKNEIPYFAEKHFNLSSNKIHELLYASKIAAKVDNAAIQDGYRLYHHTVFFDKDGNWTIVQQGMNNISNMARRYHWISDNLENFLCEPHTGIISDNKNSHTLNMTSIQSLENQKICVELVNENISNLKSSIYRIQEIVKNIQRENNTLDLWMNKELDIYDSENEKTEFKDSNIQDYLSLSKHYEMPRRIDWNLFRKIYDVHPENYEDLISIPGLGPSSFRALSLIGELIYGTKASWEDPVKFNFAHGGKDGVPYPVARKIYDKSIKYLSSAIEGAEIEREERIDALKKLSEYSKIIRS